MSPKGKRWKSSENKWDEIKKLLIANGGTQDESVSETSSEVWRIRIGKATFTLYSTGTIYSNPTLDSKVLQLRDQISDLLGPQFKETATQFVIGLDEAGKGEVLGYSVLAGVLYPSELSKTVEDIVGVADTKKRRETEYWDKLYIEIDSLKSKGLHFTTEKIPPRILDRFNVNKIMDLYYQKIITKLVRECRNNNVQIILDDYGYGKSLSDFLSSLQKTAIKIKVESKADDNYLEAKLASIVAKREKEKIIQVINDEYGFDDCPVGSGNAGDKYTIAWLERWKKTGEPWPWFVKTSFSNIRKMDGLDEKVVKLEPPIREELMSEESLLLFREGKLTVESLRVTCPKCGGISKSAKIAFNADGNLEGRCIDCNEIIKDLDSFLRYYNGFVVPDSDVIRSGILSRDLSRGKFFENFTVLMHPIVLTECDPTPGGRAELGKIAKEASLGKINLQKITDTGDDSDTNDDKIVASARKYNAIMYSKDRGIYNNAIASNVFVLR